VGHPAFLVVVFAVAALLGFATLVARRVRRGDWPGSNVLGAGIALGLVNSGSAAFILRAAAELPAPLVFPTNAIAIMAGAALLAVLLWRERLSGANVAGLFLAAAALALLWGGREGGA
jgi:drug/metabolite transporter (DMT)-like permease